MNSCNVFLAKSWEVIAPIIIIRPGGRLVELSKKCSIKCTDQEVIQHATMILENIFEPHHLDYAVIILKPEIG